VAAHLTVLIPCKDERRNIRPCIESIRSIADEILIADSGSTDGTLDIVREMGGCRIIEREYINSANFKNWAIPQAKHEWVLVVDADERVTPELAQEIRELLNNPPQDKDGFWIGRMNHYLGYRIKHCGWNTDDVIRLFRREAGHYQKRWVHAEVELEPKRAGQLENSFLHYTTWDSDLYLYKLNRYATWGAMNMKERSREPSFLAMFLRMPFRFFQLYVLRLGFLDGVPGFQVCMHTAFYAFLKQAKLWEMKYALPQPDPEAERVTDVEMADAVIDLTQERGRREQMTHQRLRRAA
jgi:glycosyltransferase involved in cell wall biosynthesis